MNAQRQTPQCMRAQTQLPLTGDYRYTAHTHCSRISRTHPAIEVGEVAILRRGSRFVYYLITKPKYFHKPPYDALRRTLVSMRDHAAANGVERIAVPRCAPLSLRVCRVQCVQCV